MLYLSLVLTAILLFLTNVVAFRTRNYKSTLWTASYGFLFGGLCLFCSVFSPLFVFNAGLLVLVAFIWGSRNAGPKFYLVSSVTVALLVCTAMILHTYWHLGDLEHRYPGIVIEDRLGYEGNAHCLTVNGVEARPLPNSPVVLSLEDDNVDKISWYKGMRRASTLRQLHDQTLQTFIDSPGFGVVRGPIFREANIILPEIPSIPQPEAEPSSSPIPAESIASLHSEPSKAKGLGSFDELHSLSVRSFINTPGFGYVKKKTRQMVGFQEHHFREVPGSNGDKLGIDSWRLQRIELISLLKHAEPCVYLSDNLPRMDELRNAKTRPLDGFEAARLPNLLKGEDLTSSQSDTTVRVLGAIRAAKQCLDCHSVQRGDLLGAFSYRLGRASNKLD